MNLNPLQWFRGARGAKALPGQPLTIRDSRPEGPFADIFDDWIPREVNPWLYEALREAVSPIDGAINMLTTLDGIVRVEAETDALRREIEEWMEGVRVNDMEQGFQAFYTSQGNEMYEQGFSIGEAVLDERARDVVQLRVADSKGVWFRRAEDGALEIWYAPPARHPRRGDGTDQIERVLRNSYPRGQDFLARVRGLGYRQLDPARIVYCGYNNEADNPYGVSIMRSTEFDARVLLVMKNSLHQVWWRFGDPAFAVTYKTAARNLTSDELEKRRKALGENLAAVLNAKRKGNSADFVNAVGKDDTIEIKVIGADGQVLEIEQPARHILEQIVSKTGLPSWMLGFHWSTAERLAERQGEIVLQQSKTRFERRRPGLKRIVATMLRARGITWREGDWQLVQELPNLQDLVAQAQARFLNMQAEMMGRGVFLGAGREGEVEPAKVTRAWRIVLPTDEHYKHAHGHAHKAEEYVEDATNLMRLERAAERGLLVEWDRAYEQLARTLGLEPAKGAKAEPVFIFDPGLFAAQLAELEEEFVRAAGAEDAALARSSYQAWLRGTLNAAAELDAEELEEAIRERTQRALAERSLTLVRAAATRALRDDILAALRDGIYDGQNPRDVARELRARFDAHEVDWVRLARSEIAHAQAMGKMDTYAAHGVESYDWSPAGGACPICTGLAAGGPYPVGAGPLPMQDSHPNCRCTVTARVD